MAGGQRGILNILPKTCTDATYGRVIDGACPDLNSLKNLVPQPGNGDGFFVPRPAATQIASFSTNVTCAVVSGNIMYGMKNDPGGSGKDIPFATNLTTGAAITINNIDTASNCPTSTPIIANQTIPPHAEVVGGYILFTHPGFDGGGGSVGATTYIVLTSGTSWTVPSGWNNIGNTVGCIGAGGTAPTADASNNQGGANGGAYAQISNISLAVGQIVPIQIGTAGGTTGSGTGPTANTWLKDAATVVAAGGESPAVGNGTATNHTVTNSFGTLINAGGTASTGVNGVRGGAGGGAGGPTGAGNNAVTTTGGSGDGGTGGAGGTANNNGAAGTELAAGAAGSGGGAGGRTGGGALAGKNGGNYGAGGGGGSAAGGLGGAGAPGCIVITYQPYTSGAGQRFYGALATTLAGSSVATVVVITSGNSWTVPATYNSSANFISAIGAGGSCPSTNAQRAGSNGGAFAQITNLSLSAGTVIPLQLGVGGGTTGSGTSPTANTWFRNGATLVAAGGESATTSSAPANNTAANSFGTTINAGGNGGAGTQSTTQTFTGSAGGGAGGPNGAGGNGQTGFYPNKGGAGDAGFGGAGGTNLGPGHLAADGASGSNITFYGQSTGVGAGGGGGAGGVTATSSGSTSRAPGDGGSYGGGAGGKYSGATTAVGGAGCIIIAFDALGSSLPWSVQNTSINQLPSVPSWVTQFNSRAYFLCNPTSGSPSLVCTDNLASGGPLQRSASSAAAVLNFGDNIPLICSGVMSLQTVTSGGVIQALYVFKNYTQGNSNIYQVTGDIATTDLTVQALNTSVSTTSPLSLCSTPMGLFFVAPDGVRYVNPQGGVSPPVGFAGTGITIPFKYSSNPYNTVMTSNGRTIRAGVDNGITGNREDWCFDYVRQIWHGPHTFPYSLIFTYGDTFLVIPSASAGASNYGVWRADIVPSLSSTYTELGNTIQCSMQTTLIPGRTATTELSTIKTVAYVGFPAAGGTFTFTCTDPNQNVISSVSQSYTTGPLTMGPVDVAWTAPVVFDRMAYSVQVQAAAGIVVGQTLMEYEESGYTVRLPDGVS